MSIKNLSRLSRDEVEALFSSIDTVLTDCDGEALYFIDSCTCLTFESSIMLFHILLHFSKNKRLCYVCFGSSN